MTKVKVGDLVPPGTTITSIETPGPEVYGRAPQIEGLAPLKELNQMTRELIDYDDPQAVFRMAGAVFDLLGQHEILEIRKKAQINQTTEFLEMKGKLLGGEVVIRYTFNGESS
jgi:hypothetical protein